MEVVECEQELLHNHFRLDFRELVLTFNLLEQCTSREIL